MSASCACSVTYVSYVSVVPDVPVTECDVDAQVDDAEGGSPVGSADNLLLLPVVVDGAVW